jgi:ankyrin repeat protein
MTKGQTKTSKFNKDQINSLLNGLADSLETIFDCSLDDGSGNRLSRFSILISSAENIEDIFQNKIFLSAIEQKPDLLNKTTKILSDGTNLTPIGVAILEGNQELVDKLLTINPKLLDKIAKTDSNKLKLRPLGVALQYNQTELVKYLLRKHPKLLFDTALTHPAIGYIRPMSIVIQNAISTQDTKFVEELLKDYPKLLNEPAQISTSGKKTTLTGIIISLALGDNERIGQTTENVMQTFFSLLKKRPELQNEIAETLEDGSTLTAMGLVVKSGNVKVVDMFLKKFPNLLNKTATTLNNGEWVTPMGIALEKRDIEMVNKLLTINPDSELLNKPAMTINGSSLTPMGIAIKRRDIEMVNELLARNLDPQLLNKTAITFNNGEGYTPMGLVIQKGDIEMFDELLTRNTPDLNLINKTAKTLPDGGTLTPFGVAIQCVALKEKIWGIIDEILRIEPKLHKKTAETLPDGGTLKPFGVAIKEGKIQILEVLFPKLSEIDPCILDRVVLTKEDGTNFNPLQLARIEKKEEVEKFIIKNLKKEKTLTPTGTNILDGQIKNVNNLLKAKPELLNQIALISREITQKPIAIAIKYGKNKMLIELIQKNQELFGGKDEEPKLLTEMAETHIGGKTEGMQLTAIGVAVKYGENTKIDILLEKYKSLLDKSLLDEPAGFLPKGGHLTPLAVAIFHGQTEIVEQLLKKDPELLYATALKTTNKDDITAIGTALFYGKDKIFKLLLDKDPELLYKTTETRDSGRTRTPLGFAIKNKKDEMVEYLINKYPRLLDMTAETDKNGKNLTPREMAKNESIPPKIKKLFPELEVPSANPTPTSGKTAAGVPKGR